MHSKCRTPVLVVENHVVYRWRVVLILNETGSVHAPAVAANRRQNIYRDAQVELTERIEMSKLIQLFETSQPFFKSIRVCKVFRC